MRNRVVATLGLAAGLLASVSAQARELTFEERVEAQRAIERVYYAHQIGATRPFEEAVPRAVLEKKVRTYLEQSVALEELWGAPVTGKALQRELERMAEGTRMPERLLELYAALGHDGFLVRECLARPVLVDRLARSFFSDDERFHLEERRATEALREDLVRGRLDAFSEHPQRRIVILRRKDLAAEEFERWLSSMPERLGAIGPLVEEREAFVVRVVLDRRPDELHVASYSVAKRRWDDWWEQARGDLPDGMPEAAASLDDPLPLPEHRQSDVAEIPAACIPGDSWNNGSLDDVPDPRRQHTAVWTGSEMIVWGGYDGSFVNTGGRYDPATDSWKPTALTDAPQARFGHTAVWTGSVMVVWGGLTAGPVFSLAVDTGGRYDPATDSWTATSTTGAPSARSGHTAVWTGSIMIVWGGVFGAFPTGGRYNPATDTWTATSTTNTPPGRAQHTAVWTGSRMVVWGGYDALHNNLDTGGRYNPATDLWQTTGTGAPSARWGHTAVWSGSRMVVWGGTTAFGVYANTGGRYDPVTSTWTATSTTNAPVARSGHNAVWTGSRMVIWGGSYDTGGRYDPVADTWAATSTTNAPSSRGSHTAVWTGTHVVVWGGQSSESYSDSGGRYDPANDSWTPTSTPNGPSARHGHTAVWTGSHMVVWGGSTGGAEVNTGGRYDPATDSWTATSTVDAPVARVGHTAVWTGSRMVVWGGVFDGFALYTGGRYDPAADTWLPTSTTGAPLRRSAHTAVWTGSLMVVWGGGDLSEPPAQGYVVGGRYDPETDTWWPTSEINAPAIRILHTAVWTGTEMVVWGGLVSDLYHDTGGRYDPTTDSWTATSTTHTPSARAAHTAVWTGSEMVVWGGLSDGVSLKTGGRYDPVADHWEPTSTDAPTARYNHTAVWTGNLMVVWGGFDGSYANTGGRYDVLTDSWTPTVTTEAPTPRWAHTAVWTGSSMLVWGGLHGAYVNSGGRYVLGPDDTDHDGDGRSACQGDCDDADATVFAPPREILNLRWPSPTELAWDTDRPNSGPGTRYDVMYGDLAAVSDFGTGPADTCMGDDVPDVQIVDVSPQPAEGEAWFFLVRGDNGCGKGRYETATDGSDRLTTACP